MLVGVNHYKQPLRSLKGCVTDVDLQRELLIHRFGFNPADILCLKDQDATRENILDGFEDHLIDACGADDLAVFHFSGHGRRIADPSPVQVAGDERDPLNSTLIPWVGIDPSVMAEWDAIQATFGAIRRLELVPYQSDETLYSGEVHYILSRLTDDYSQLFQSRGQGGFFY